MPFDRSFRVSIFPFRILVLFIILAPLLACHPHRHHVIRPAIYYWKTVYRPSQYELNRWKEAAINKIYLHCFDIVSEPESNKLSPTGIIRNIEQMDTSLQIVPVIFITQDAIRKLDHNAIKPLAGNISQLLSQLFLQRHPGDEVQIDCDWTGSSRENYFSLLTALRNEAFFTHKRLSCTIRFHQVKYRLRSGIPPVDKGLLMCYNMGDLRQAGVRNSILDAKLAANYLKDLDSYPLHLDIALPLFSWCLWFRENHFNGILRDIRPDQITQDTALFRIIDRNLYRIIKDSSWEGFSFKKGDQIRTETSDKAAMLNIATLTSSKILSDSLNILLFDSDSLSLSKHPNNELQAVFNVYR